MYIFRLEKTGFIWIIVLEPLECERIYRMYV